VDQVAVLVEHIRPFLAGQKPEVVGGVLADLLAMLLAGHFAETEADTAKLREELLRLHFEAVRELIGPNERMILERTRRDSQ
jgi:hypothetical protein